jgi:hypothetical protein
MISVKVGPAAGASVGVGVGRGAKLPQAMVGANQMSESAKNMRKPPRVARWARFDVFIVASIMLTVVLTVTRSKDGLT